MTEIISVRFKPGGKQYYFAPQGLTVKAGDGVILDTVQGLAYGECVRGNHLVTDDMVLQPLRTVVRIATERDKATAEQNRRREQNAMRICKRKIAHHGLDMKLVDAEYSFEGNKVLFFFTSDGRVDFRALVKDLASSLHARIELRQIGVRDEARMLGGLGICGKPFCCGQFLKEFQPVSIKMAKTQGLSLNPAKISGTCGRLMCCLKYEQHAYEDAVKRCPKQDSFVETPDGVGTVTAVNLLRERVKVNLENSDDNSPKTYPVEEISVVRSGKGKRPEGYVAPPPEQLAKLRRATPPSEEQESAAAPPAPVEVEQAPNSRKSSVQPPRAKKKPKQTQKPKLGKGAPGAQEGKREAKAVP
ncbi:MAG: stage 0 sporulation family protein, partial [Oscillospiraceae bacterium]|nr:stage 0 sporulation family protein [Oscillospiraceae bacterium]